MRALQECLQRATGAIVLIAACGLLHSCARPSGGRVFLVGESRVVSGIVGAQKGIDLKNLQISLIDTEGQRLAPSGLKYSSEQGQFSFQLRDSDLYEAKKATQLDQLLSMGGALPLVSTGRPDLVDKVDKYSRIEIMPAVNSTLDYQAIPYFQAVLPLSRRNLFAGKDTIGIDGQLVFNKAGFVRVKVVNESGQPLAGIKVSGISDGKLESGVPLWHDTLLRPVFVKTGTDGTAFIGPLDASVELTRYHILALAEGYCTYLSAPSNNFSLIEKAAPVVTLRSCAGQPGASNALVPSFPEKLKYLKIDGRDVVHTKDDSLFLRLDSLTPNLRGARVTVYETDSNYAKSSEPVEGAREVSTFQSEFSIPLPKIFKTTDSTEGKFIIEITRLKNPGDDEASFPDLVVFGHRKVGPPSRDLLMKVSSLPLDVVGDGGIVQNPGVKVDDWTNVKVVSVSGHTNIVPGLAGGTFTIRSPICSDGDELGFSIPAYSMIEPVFKACVKGVATFTAEEAGFLQRAAKIVQAGGRQRWNIFIKDKYGNVSESLDDPNAAEPKRLNVVTVIVDTGRPVPSDDDTSITENDLTFKNAGTTTKILDKSDLADGKMELHFDDAIPADAICLPSKNPDLAEKDSNGRAGDNATFLGGVSAFIFRDELNRLSARSLSPNANGNYERVAMMIHRWIIGGSAESVSSAPQSSYTRCRELDASEPPAPFAVSRELKLSDFTFNADETVDFYMRYIDFAGLQSNPIRYTIAKCPAPPITEKCWQD